MSEREYDERQSALLETYRSRLRENPAAEPPRELDPGLAEVARHLEADMGGPSPDPSVNPDPAFVASLRQRIVAEAERLDSRSRPAYGPGVNGRVQNLPRKRRVQRLPSGQRSRRRSVYWGALAVGLAVLLVVGGILWDRDPNEVSAHEIVQRAKDRLETPALAGIDSFKLTEVTTTSFSFDGPQRIETTHWFQAPDKWRIETAETLGSGDPARVEHYGTVSTGDEVWLIGENGAERAGGSRNAGDIVEEMRFGEGIGSLDLALVAENECYSPTRQGDDTVAGRATYVIDLGVSKCPSASMPEVNGRRVIWVDQETFFILKSVLYDGTPGQEETVVSETVVTEIDYNLSVPADTFAYTPPATETSGDGQPTGEPTAPTTLEGFRGVASYPIFVPTYLPAGFESVELGRDGGTDDSPQVRMTYSDASGDRQLSVLDGPAGCCLSYKAGTPVTLPGGHAAHFVSGEPESGAGIIWWEQGGAYVSIDSTQAAISHEELLKIAASMSDTAALEPIPGPGATEPPAATAIPSTEELEILYPGWLPQPSTITEEQRSDGRGGEFTMLLIDHKPDDDANDVLRLSEYPLATAPEPAVDSQSTVEQIGGREVTVIHRGEFCTMYSWQQDGMALSLSNAYDPPGEILYSCDEMRQIVASIEPGTSPPTN